MEAVYCGCQLLERGFLELVELLLQLCHVWGGGGGGGHDVRH